MYHFNYVHCGVETLSMSKRIMDKVFDVSNDCGVKIYYQYTDSIHLNYDDVDKIVKRIYKQNHNQDLVGDGLGNFHVDFSMDGAVTEIYGVESLFLGKETYIDMLESTDTYCNTINSEHIRCRGIPTSCIQFMAIQDKKVVWICIRSLYKGKAIEFDLTDTLTQFVIKELNSIQFQLLQNLFGKRNLLDMNAITY